MRRHSTDLVGLIFGTAFTIAGIGFLVRETTDTVVNPAWATGLCLMLLGVIALVGTLARGSQRDRDQLHEHDHQHSLDNLHEPVDDVGVPAAVTSDE